MENSAQQLLNRMELLYENIFNLLSGFQEASNTASSSVTVALKKPDGTFENHTVNSFQKISQELTRIDNNFKSITNEDNLSYILNADGSISQTTKTSFINAEYLTNFTFDGNSCIVDKKSAINDLVYPLVKIPITIDSKLMSDVFCRTLEIGDGWEEIGDNPTLLDMEYLKENGKVSYKEITRTLSLEKQQVKYFGKFTVESLISEGGNRYTVVLDKVKYTGLNNIGNSINLKDNDILVSKSGASKYIINSIDNFNKKLNLTRIAGSEVLTVGIENLYFNETLTTTENIVGVPIKPLQKVVVFLSTENLKNISFPSVGIKLDTTDYKVIYNDTTYTIDEFFGTYVTNFYEYLMAFVDETNIPVSLGIKPKVPVLTPTNFKVVQINKHLTDTKTSSEIEELNKRKQTIQNEIDYKQKQIDLIQNEIDTQKFASNEEKTKKLDTITSYRTQITTLKTNLLGVAQDIDTNAVKYGLKNVKPKYRVISFWEIQEPIYSPLTKSQNIIKYDVQYRYLTKGVDTLENTSYKMVSGGKEITVVFSPWMDLQTRSLNKVLNDDNELVWETPIMDSVDDININQLSISITEYEAVEIRIRAVSEAGYPISPLKSEWSEIIRVDFPTDLKQNNLTSTISQNISDLNLAEFENILKTNGLLNHVSDTIKESEKTFFHHAKNIASGQYTSEQKNIALDTMIATILKEIERLKNSDVSNNVTVNLIDFNNESYVVTNNTTMEINAGNYCDTVNLLDSTKWGAIIRKKGYIKIKNANTVPIEMKSLVPGTSINDQNGPNYYNVPIKNVGKLVQDARQILYFRNVDLTGQKIDAFRLVMSKKIPTVTYPRAQDMDLSVADSEKNIVYRGATSVMICKLISTYSSGFVGFTTEHPKYNYDVLNDMNPEFDRLRLYTSNVKAQQYQSELEPTDYVGLGFEDSDFYAVGENTCGAFFYPIITNQESVSVVGGTTVATLIIPKESEVLIPFMFEYRMTDRLGNIDGTFGYDANNGLTYSKKIGIDMLLNNDTFKFDINVTSKLKSKVASIETKNVSSVLSSYNNEDKSTLG